MFCPSCGTRLVAAANFCHNCGEPAVAVAAPAPVPVPAPVPAAQACFTCGGLGKAHYSSMPHDRPGCFFCETCAGCDGTGAIPWAAAPCPHCRGRGRAHESNMPHTEPNCLFCSDCKTCNRKGRL